MKTTGWLLTIGFLVYGTFCWNHYVCSIKGFCGEEPSVKAEVDEVKSEEKLLDESIEEPIKEIGPNYPICFVESDDHLYKGDGFEAHLSSLKAQISDNKGIEITGKYYKSEKNPTLHENIGIARALKIKAEIANYFGGVPIEVKSQLLGDVPPSEQWHDWSELNVKEITTTTSSVIKNDDRVLVYFGFASSEPQLDSEVKTYLNQLSQQLISTKKTVSIIGHTDNVGKEEANDWFGSERAKAVQSYLISKGVPEAQLTVGSKGEKEPISNNDTSEGRRKNRRVEILF